MILVIKQHCRGLTAALLVASYFVIILTFSCEMKQRPGIDNS